MPLTTALHRAFKKKVTVTEKFLLKHSRDVGINSHTHEAKTWSGSFFLQETVNKGFRTETYSLRELVKLTITHSLHAKEQTLETDIFPFIFRERKKPENALLKQTRL